MALSSPSVDRDTDAARNSAVAFRGPKPLCAELSLMLEARGIEHDVCEDAGAWIVAVPPSLAHRAYDEISRYSAERNVPRSAPARLELFPGAMYGAVGYVLVLLLTAYCAGINLFGIDWYAAGALDAGAAHEWWRALTALTLHVDQEHLLGNLLFGVVAGVAAGRLFGPGIAWASIVGAAALANYTEILIAPIDHRAVGASTAVFATLGLLSGWAWRLRLTLRERRWYRWAPLIAGISLLTLLGAGNAHVDVLGHALGFVFGVCAGWLYAYTGLPSRRGNHLQIASGVAAALLVGLCWLMALRHAA
jgi:rhomboid protease GluP